LVGWLADGMDDALGRANGAPADGGRWPVSAFSARRLAPGLILGYAGLSDPEIRDGVARLSVALRSTAAIFPEDVRASHPEERCPAKAVRGRTENGSWRISTLQHIEPRPIAAIRAQMPIRDVPSRFREYLDRGVRCRQDGSNLARRTEHLLYRAAPPNLTEMNSALERRRRSLQLAAWSTAKSGWRRGDDHALGDYSLLGPAHQAVVDWCKAEGQRLAGVSWEVYGHWSDDPSKRRTESTSCSRLEAVGVTRRLSIGCRGSERD
jgi:hypothetical protein